MVSRLRGILFKSAARRYLDFARILFKSKGRIPKTANFQEVIKASGVLGNSKFNTFEYISAWHEAEKKWNEGAYFASVSQRSALLQEMYEKQGIFDTSYFPPFLSKDFGAAIGHVGLMAAHLEASKIGILPPGRRFIPITRELASRAITKSILSEYQEVPTENCGEILDLPSTWHISERLQMIRGVDGFIDLYVMLEKLYSQRIVNKENPILALDSSYEEQARFALKNLGLPDKSWFVSIHIRNAGFPGLRRNQPNDSYISAIRFIISQGGFVIRIGDASMEPFPQIDSLIDLTTQKEYYWLHSYVLANSEFHIGTTSGPDWIPSLFGVPTLITNTTAIGRNMHSLCDKSRFIPKHIISSSQKWSFSRILESTEAYSENEIDAKYAEYQLAPNTDAEILQATQEMFKSVLGQDELETFAHMTEINKIRSQLGAVGYGSISESFINMNETSFLK
jgi:hypothetical protein